MQTVALGDTVDERVGEMAEQITVCDLSVPLQCHYITIEFGTNRPVGLNKVQI